MLVAPFVVAWDALRYLARVALPALGRALQRALRFLAGIIRGIIRPFQTPLGTIVNLVARVMESVGRAWSVIVAPFARIFAVVVRFLGRRITATIEFVRTVVRAVAQIIGGIAGAARRLLRIVDRFVTACERAIGTMVNPVLRLVGRTLSGIVAIVRSAQAQLAQLIRLLLGPVRTGAHRAGLALRRLSSASGRVLHAATALARRFLWWLVRPIVVPMRTVARAVVSQGRRLSTRVRATRASTTAAVRAALSGVRAHIRRR